MDPCPRDEELPVVVIAGIVKRDEPWGPLFDEEGDWVWSDDFCDLVVGCPFTAGHDPHAGAVTMKFVPGIPCRIRICGIEPTADVGPVVWDNRDEPGDALGACHGLAHGRGRVVQAFCH
jgi:hypothetical protein